LSVAFLIVEAFLYGIILTSGGDLLVYSCFSSIVICFVHALIHVKQGDKLLIAGLACTVMADLCLVVWSPVQRLWGMVFFLAAQSLYAIRLHRQIRSNVLLIIRISLTVVALAVTVIVLKEATDALALVSLCYYANLIMNIVTAFTRFRDNKLLSIGFVLFLLCDTVIGLQVACGGYLPIEDGSLLHQIIFMPFNLAWFFYLPSQVLISLSAKKHGK
jgi:uncharacterized membrane protein YhhN